MDALQVIAASTLAFFVGPVIVRLLPGRAWVSELMDAFVLMTIGGLVFLHLLPEGILHGGWIALPAAALGILIPTFGERMLRRSYQKVHAVVLVLALLALGLHTFIDGVNLASHGGLATAAAHDHHHDGHGHGDGHAHDETDHGEADPASSDGTRTARITGVIVHRIPVGIGIWWIVRGVFGLGLALSMILGMAGATAGGYFFSEAFLSTPSSAAATAVVQALFAGSLLHVVLHRHDHPGPASRHARLASGLGGLLGLGAVVAVGHFATHGHGPGRGPMETFLKLALASAPALLFAYVLVGFSHSFLPHRWLGFLRRGPVVSQAVRGVALGLPIPVCSCGVVPLYRTLATRGVPLAASIAFLVATPELELAAVLLSFRLLGPEVALARLAAAAGLALLVAIVIGSLRSRRMPPQAPSPESGPAVTLVGRGLRFGFGEVVDHTAPWILIGLVFAAVLEPFVEPRWFTGLPAGVDVPLMALIGFPLYVCASGSTPLAALLLLKGLSPGAALAFLLTGPATNVTTLGVLGRLHGARVAVTFALLVVGLATAFGWAVNLALPEVPAVPRALLEEHRPDAFAVACGVLLALVFLASFLRQGARGFVDRIATRTVSGDGPDPHDHEHGGPSCEAPAAGAQAPGAASR